MIKKLLIIFTLIIAVLLTLFVIFLKLTHVEWGHSFDFNNQLGYEIDSLKITIGDKENWLYPSLDSAKSIEGNLDVPAKNYPHKVEILVYENGNKHLIEADSFNCYNCDGYHEYILKKSGAKYKFIP